MIRSFSEIFLHSFLLNFYPLTFKTYKYFKFERFPMDEGIGPPITFEFKSLVERVSKSLECLLKKIFLSLFFSSNIQLIQTLKVSDRDRKRSFKEIEWQHFEDKSLIFRKWAIQCDAFVLFFLRTTF